MTSPIFFIVSKNQGNRKATVGIIVHEQGTGDRPATAEEQKQVHALVSPTATLSLADALRDRAYPYSRSVRVWDKRADVRAQAARFNAMRGHFDWVIVQLGKEQRDLSRKPIGYQIVYGPDAEPSAWNDHNDAALIEAGTCPNLYIKTRAIARKRVAEARDEDAGMNYRLRTLYA